MLVLPGNSGSRLLFSDLLRSSADSVPTSNLQFQMESFLLEVLQTWYLS